MMSNQEAWLRMMAIRAKLDALDTELYAIEAPDLEMSIIARRIKAALNEITFSKLEVAMMTREVQRDDTARAIQEHCARMAQQLAEDDAR
jgi:hypothetical protein